MALLSLWIGLAMCVGAALGLYNVGAGIYDITGPSVEIGFMGYASTDQKGTGIHLRQFCRAFVFVKGTTRVTYVTLDSHSPSYTVRKEVIRQLAAQYGNTAYTMRNVIFSCTHAHSTPGGYLVDFIYDVTCNGFVKETWDALVSGIFQCIVRAHENIEPGIKLYYGEKQILDINTNRSPYAYLQNPAEERARYDHNTDRNLMQISIRRDSDSSLIGVINWYPVHPTSMNITNKLVSSDNMGYASILMEKELNPAGTLVGKGDVVCAFVNSNQADVSPNTAGPRCEYTGQVCDQQFQQCPGAPIELCYAQGPGRDMFESVSIIGKKLAGGGLDILTSTLEELDDNLACVHKFVEMPEQVVSKYDTVSKTFSPNVTCNGCTPALGVSFAAGTTDGAAGLIFSQGTSLTLLQPYLYAIGTALPNDISCHSPKPILLNTGRIFIPLRWHPTTIAVSMIRLGKVLIATVPGEFTTMSGRRMRDVVSSVAGECIQNPKVIVVALSNDYIQYVTTFEEYQVQRYEGASTLFGPCTLDIFLNKYKELATAICQNTTVEYGPEPVNLVNNTVTLVTPVIFDAAPLGKSFGQCVLQPNSVYNRTQIVHVTFISGNPRNNLKHGNTYLTVELQGSTGAWAVVATDANWETKFIWERTNTLLGTSQVHIYWEIPSDATTGVYRIKHYGDWKGASMTAYVGVSSTFNSVKPMHHPHKYANF